VQWWQVRIGTPREAVDALSAVLQAWPDVQGVMIENDIPDGPLHPEYGEFLDDHLLEQAEELVVTVYLPGTDSEVRVRNRIDEAVSAVAASGLMTSRDATQLTFELVDESAWAYVWQQEFEPIPIGAKWLIVPKWLRDEPGWADGRIPIFLEPGRAFGTGMHATTQLCLQALESVLPPAADVLDIGTGTGILAIGAAKLNAHAVIGIDLDPIAVEAAQENVDDNGVASTVTVKVGDLMTGVGAQSFDVVLANILRDPVLALTPDAYDRLKVGGRFISSGYLQMHENGVHKQLREAGFEVERVLRQDDWVATVAVKPS
jgi:ribosomal protein L11 methyltransferase